MLHVTFFYTSLLVSVVCYIIEPRNVIKKEEKTKWQGEGIILLHFYLQQQPQPRFFIEKRRTSSKTTMQKKSVYRMLS